MRLSEIEERRFIFYRAIMEIIIAKKNKDRIAQANAYNTAILALNGDKTTVTGLLLRRHKYKDDACATSDAIAFLKKNKV